MQKLLSLPLGIHTTRYGLYFSKIIQKTSRKCEKVCYIQNENYGDKSDINVFTIVMMVSYNWSNITFYMAHH